MKKELSRALKRFYGVGDCGFTLMTSVEGYYFNFFLTNIAAFSIPVVTFITTLTSVIDACLSWIYGAVLNSIKSQKWGRYRSWLILTAWMVPFLYAFQFLKLGDGVLSVVVIVVASVLVHIAWNFPWTANVAMINVAAKTPDDRVQLSSTRAAWANLSKVIFSYVGPTLAAFFAGWIGESNQFAATAFVLGCVMFALYFAHFKMFDGYEEVETSSADVTKEEKTDGKDMLKALFGNRPLIFLLLSDIAKWMFNFICMGVATYYFTYVAKNAGLLATYILVSNLLCVVGSYLSKPIAKRFSARGTTIAVFLFMTALLCAAFLVYQNVLVVIILMSLAQLGYGITYACTPALYGDTCIYSEWKTGKDATGWIMGLQNVPLKIGNVSRGLVISACLGAVAFDASVDAALAPAAWLQGISIGFTLVPAAALFLGALLLIFGFDITKEKVMSYQSEIDRRKQTAA